MARRTAPELIRLHLSRPRDIVLDDEGFGGFGVTIVSRALDFRTYKPVNILF